MEVLEPIETLRSDDKVFNKTEAVHATIHDFAKKVWKSGEARVIPVSIEGSESEGFTATSLALPGCIAEGDTLEEALADFNVALAALLETYSSEGMATPWRQWFAHEINPDARTFMVNL